MSWQECTYGDAVCSVAAGTWIVGLVALFAFAAACQAVAWSSAMFFIEVEPRLGQSLCPMHRVVDHPFNKEIFLVPQQDSGLVIFRCPLDFDRSDYYEHHSAFKNLGRTALANVDVYMRLADEKGSGRSAPICVHIGNVLCNDEVHVAFFASRVFEKLTVTWSNASQSRPKSKGRESVRFFPADPSSDIAVFPVPDIRQLPLPAIQIGGVATPAGGAQQPAQPKPPPGTPPPAEPPPAV